jgi:hypothetical protein
MLAATAHAAAAGTVGQSALSVLAAVSDQTLQALIYVAGSVVTALIAAVSAYLVARMTSGQRRERKPPTPPVVDDEDDEQ